MFKLLNIVNSCEAEACLSIGFPVTAIKMLVRQTYLINAI